MSVAVRLSAIIAAAVSIAACAHVAAAGRSPLNVGSNWNYSTFFVLPGHSSGDPALDRQLEADVVMKLTDEGLVETSPETAEVVVVVHSATRTTRSRSALYAGWGGWDWRIVELDGSSDSETYQPGSLVVDVFDAWSKQLVWHAVTRRVPQHPGTSRLAPMPQIAGIFREGPLSSQTPSMRIVFSSIPAALVQIEGEPRYEAVNGTELQRVSNTRALILRDSAGVHYLRLGDRWMESYDLTGLWSPAGTVPDGAERALDGATGDARTDLFTSVADNARPPVVCVSTTPATLILIDGEPHYEPVDGTSLQRVSNTSSIVYREATDRELYVRLPEGWFRAWTTNGPWQPMPEDHLPEDLRTSNEELRR